MASYLGKISAIVSANTAGYVRSLNDAAAQTRDFAKTIRSDITRSSNDASKAFNSILSPLQKLQRALDAASSQRLSFKGVEGAINNVKQLRQQINEIRDLQLAVRITGADGIDDLRENLLSLSSTDIQAAVRVTGSEDVEQLQRRLNRFSDRTVNLLARAAGVENIDQLAEKVDSLSDRELRLSVRAINENAIERAKRQLEQLTSASAEIATPLAAANRQLTGFAAEIQAALLPGFSQVQKAALQLEQDIRSGAEIGEERYTRLRDTVERTARAVAAVGELDLGSGAAIQQFQQQLQAVNETAIEIAGRQLQIEIGSEEVASVLDEISRLQEELTGVRSGETRLRVSAEEAVEAKRAIDRLAASRDEIQVRVEADASELRRIDEEIRSLQATISLDASEIIDAQRRLDELTRARAEASARVNVDSSEVNRLDAEIAEARRRVESLDTTAAIGVDISEIIDAQRRLDELTRTRAEASARVNVDSSEVNRLDAEIAEARRRVESLDTTAAIGVDISEIIDAQRRLDELTRTRAEASARVNVDSSEVNRLDAEIAEARRRVESLDTTAAIGVDISEIIDAQRRLDELTRTRAEASARVNVDSSEVNRLDAEIAEARRRVESLDTTATIGVDISEIIDAQRRLDELTRTRAEASARVNVDSSEVNRLDAEIAALSSRVSISVETEGASEARQQLESLRRQREEQAALFESQTAELNRLEVAAEEAGRAIERMIEAAAKADREIADLAAKIDAIEQGASTEVDIDTTEGQRRLDELRRKLEELRADRALAISFGSATGREVGEFSNISLEADGVRIDRSGTRRRLRDLDAEIAQAESRLAIEVPVTVDAEAAKAQLESLRQQRVEIKARVTADRDGLTAVTAELNQAKQRLEAAPTEVRLAADFVDLTRQINEAKKQIRDLANNRVGVELDAAEALAEINLLEDLIRSLEGRRATIRASFDDDARREAEAFQADIDRLEAREVEIRASIEVNDEDLQRGLRLLEQAQRAVEQQQFDRQAVADSRARRAAEAEETERLAKALARLREQSDFVITGRVQNFDQVRQELGTILSQIGRLDATDRVQFDLDIGTLNRILSEGEVDDLATAQAILDRINAAIGERRTLDLDAETAQREADELAATIDRLRANADFAITGRPQNLDQVQSELQRILGTIDRLNDQQRGELRVSAVIDAINAGDLQQAQQALADLRQQAEAGAQFNLDTEEAEKAATDLQNRLNGIRERVEFTITGRVQNFDQARQELSAVLGDVSRLEQAQREAFSQRLQSAGEIIESAEIGKLDQAANILQEIRSELAGIKGSPVRDPLGASLDDPIRQVDVLKGGINSLQGQLDNLPAPIRQRFLPELRRLRDQFTQAEKSPQRFGQELENAADDVRRLSAEVRRISQAQGLGSFADGLDDTALRGAIGNLQALQQILNRIGATAGSDGARQFDRLRAAIQRATREGTVGSEAFQRELRQITQDAAAAAAATGKIGRAAAFREIQRGGDIARGGFDKLSLAAQQAAFAIDDFFSATGDFSQKIRAVQNNVTQLAFILRGTKGLFIAIGAAIAAQATVSLFKWAQGSVDAEDKTQALNDALARQKSLVEELKQAFDSLGDSLTRGIFDEATERARNLESQIKSVTDAAQRQIDFAASRDAGVQEQRGIQASLQSQLEEASDGGERARIQRQIDQARDEEVRRTDQVRQRALSITPEDILREIADSIDAVAEARAFVAANTGLGLVGGNQQAVDTAFRVGDAEAIAVQQSFADLTAELGDDLLAAERVLQDRLLGLDSNLKDLQDSVNPVVGFFNSRALGDAGGVEGNALKNEADLIGSLLEEVRFAIAEQNSLLIGNAEVTVAEIAQKLRSTLGVIDTSLDGFGPLAEEQRKVAAELFRIQQELQGAAGDDGRFGTADDTLTRNDIQERQRQIDALQNQSSALESAVRSTEAFSSALDRLAGDLADTVLGEAQGAEQQARRDVNRRQAELNTLPADATPRERLDATASLRDAQQRQAELAASADDIAARRRQLAGRQAFEVEQFQQQARAGNLGDELQRQIRARDAIQGRIDAGQNVASDERARLAELTASIADAFENSLAGVQLAAEADALDVQRQEVDAGFQRAQQQAEERQRSVDSGLELIQSPEQTAAQRGLDQFNEAINGALSLAASELNSIAPNLPQLDDGIISLQELGTLFSQFPNQIGGIREQFLANLQQARDNITGNISAQIAQFDVERSRPSRQALQAQDINTQQGRAELNRLLRGDDANRDQPILQGIKEQTAVLKLIDQRIDEVKTAVGVAGA